MAWQNAALIGVVSVMAVVIGGRTVPLKTWAGIGAFYGMVTGSAVIFVAGMVVYQDHFLLGAGPWGPHGLHELMLAISCFALGLLQLGVGIVLLRKGGR
jgi:hypothetical protein